MGTKITVSLRSLVLAAAAVLAVLAAYSIGSRGSGAATASTADTEATGSRTMLMTGTGEAMGVPDQLVFRLSVNKKADDVTDALAQANARMRRVLAAIAHEGVERKDVRTTGLSIRPDYAYSSNRPPVITGYVVTESAVVLVRDLGTSGKAVDAAVRAGGNSVRVHGLGLKIGDRDALLSQARDAAVAEAQAKAKQYAEATGQSIGRVVSLKEVRATPPSPTYGIRADLVGAMAAEKVPIRAGSQDLKVTVAIVWQLD